MDTSQYMSMFLEESMDNLQTLNEALLQLEMEPDNIDKLNEIFRVAHTIKGMAATMGFSVMAELTHKMEDVLSKFRNGDLKVTEHVVTVLFKCLDTLEQMVNCISENSDEEVPIEDLIISLEVVAKGEELAIAHNSKSSDEALEEKDVIQENSKNDFELKLNEYDISIMKQAQEKGFIPYEMRIKISENTLLKSARAFLIFNSLEDGGEIIKSIPDAQDIEQENFDFHFDLVYLSTKKDKEIQNEIMNLSEVTEVIVREIKPAVGSKIDETIQEKTHIETTNHSEMQPEKVKKENKSENNSKRKNEASVNKNGAPHKKTHQSVRVDLDRIDNFMNLVSELVIHRTRLEQLAIHNKITDLHETLEHVARSTTDLQDLVMKIRMLPVDTVFNRFPRLIRDLSVDLGKEMELIIKGADTELDRTVIDEIGEPLVHLIRNAADHGIEHAEERIAKGKDPVGKIKLMAYQEGTKAVIRIEDDGAGINVKKVKEKAEKKGINTEGMSESDIKNLIFAQGFSTADNITDISGRGVGMDVVKTKIGNLGGTVEVVSEFGKGSAFIITLPLTLQIIQALLVKVSNETMAISLGYIDRVIEYKAELIKKSNNKEVILYDGRVIPFIRVNEKLALEDSKSSKYYIIITKVGGNTVGLMVDSLLGQQEIVIKPLGKTLKDMKEYIGATILGDGLVTLILDVATLV